MRKYSIQLKIPIWQRIILILFGLFLFLVSLEVGLRLGGFVLSSLQEYRNAQSIRQKGSYRIMCLGESTTVSPGQEYCWPSQLENILNQRNLGMKFSVINKGRGATNTSGILEELESNLNKYKPHMVIAMMGVNDDGPHMPQETICTKKTSPLLKSLKLYKLSRLLWLHIVTKAKEINIYKPQEIKRSAKPLSAPPVNKAEKRRTEETILIENNRPLENLENAEQKSNGYIDLARANRRNGKYLQAEETFKQALELNPRNDKAYVGLGELYRQIFQGEASTGAQAEEWLKKAEETFKQALELNPRNDNAYSGLGMVFCLQNKFLQAIESFKKAVELNPKNDDAYWRMGIMYQFNLKEYAQAEEVFKMMAPKNPERYIKLGELSIFERQGRIEELIKEIKELNLNDIQLDEILAVLYSEKKEYKIAEEYYEKVNALRLKYYNPVTGENYLKLKKILDKRGIKLVCVQYPMRSVEPLKKIFEGQEGIIFVDNEKLFKKAVKKEGYKEYFTDMFGSDFGHCTAKGNRLLAENIANAILEYFR